MGVFDTYGTTQLKAGSPWMKQYKIGDPVEIPDGVYVDDDGLVVISEGRFIAELDKLYDYWGNELNKVKVLQ